jgi:transcription termination factor Rho
VRHAELAIARARRRAEAGEDVVFVVDSLTRLGVAHRDPAAVKPLFGSGRELEEEGSGSLTVIATVLTGTDDGDGAAEAVETTENATLALDPELAAAGVVPALDAARSGVGREEKLREPDELEAARKLRGRLRDKSPAEAAEELAGMIRGSESNSELLRSL